MPPENTLVQEICSIYTDSCERAGRLIGIAWQYSGRPPAQLKQLLTEEGFSVPERILKGWMPVDLACYSFEFAFLPDLVRWLDIDQPRRAQMADEMFDHFSMRAWLLKSAAAAVKFERDLVVTDDSSLTEIYGPHDIDRVAAHLVELLSRATRQARESQNAACSKPVQVSAKRKEVIQSLLAERGWSINDWATQSNVDFHTAKNFVDGNANPFPSTLKKLADSLGLAVAQLPD